MLESLKSKSFIVFTSITICTIQACFISVSAATYPSLRFEKPKVDGDIHNEKVYCVLNDRHGFLWFCTDYGGLTRYDGYTLKRFQHDPKNKLSISGDSTRAVLEDKDGTIWIGTVNSGLNRFDPKTETFVRYLPDSLKQKQIHDLYEDSFGTIWIATMGSGLLEFDKTTGKFTQYLPQENNENSLANEHIWKILEDPLNKGNLWIATSDGLDYLERESMSFIHYKPDSSDPASIGSPYITDLTYDSNNTLWIGSYNGVSKFDASSNTFRHFRLIEDNLKSTAGSNIVFAIYKDSNGRLWVGLHEGGLKYFDKELETFVSYQNEPNNPLSLRSKAVLRHGIVEDSAGILWILTQEGVNRLNLNSKGFRNYQYHEGNPDSLSGNVIFGLYEDQKQRLWVGTNDNGLNFFDEVNQRFINYRHESNNSPSLSSIYSILVDSDENLWIGTSRGLYRREKNATEFFHYSFDSDERLNHMVDMVFSLLEDVKGDIWIGMNKGLRKYDKNSEKFTHYLHDEKDQTSIVENWAWIVYEDNMQRLWIGTLEGLDLYDPKLDQFIHFNHAKSGLSSDKITTIYQSKDGSLWVGTSDKGLNHLSVNGKLIAHYGREDGLSTDAVYGISEDEEGLLWISTPAGLSRFDRKSLKFQNFYTEDGVYNEAYNQLASLTRANGEIVFGGMEGIDLFHPKDVSIDDGNEMPKVVLTDFLLFNRSVPIQPKPIKGQSLERETTPEAMLEKNIPEFYLEQSISHTEELILSHKESMFSFEFAALEYLRPDKIQYSYVMEGLDEKWINTAPTKRFATYMNVPSGEYVFKVKSTNKRGVWNEKEHSIKVIILPPPWLTWWAKTIYVLLAVSLLLSTYLLRTASLRRRAESLQQSVEERTQELAEEKEKLALEKNKVEQLLSRKNEEFANVSHEFKTPLTLILGPLSQAIKDVKTPEESNRLGMVQRNAYRLLRMVDQLLNLETFRIRTISRRVPTAFGKMIHLLTKAFSDITREKSIQLNINKIEDVNFEFTVDALEKIMLNLLSNAVKYTNPGGSITVTCVRTNDNHIEIAVSDTGIGIPEDKLEVIFERYNRVLDENSERVTGAGIGLALVKKLVEAHGGCVSIASQLDKGTTITIRLPIVNEVAKIDSEQAISDEFIAMELMSLSRREMNASEKEVVREFDENSVRPSLLVIEDNADMRDFIVENLRKEYNVKTANDGEVGVALAIEHVPDLIISDVMMPKMDGYQVTSTLRNNKATNHIPIILLTAKSDLGSRLKGWKENADEYLTKPFSIEELLLRTKNLLNIRSILKKRFAEKAFGDKSPSNVGEGSLQDEEQELFLENLNKVIEGVYFNAEVKVKDISIEMAMSERQFHRKLKSIVDLSPSEYLRRFRLDKAQKLLMQGKSANFVAFEVGFSSQSYFGRCFKAQYGVSPSNLCSS